MRVEMCLPELCSAVTATHDGIKERCESEAEYRIDGNPVCGKCTIEYLLNMVTEFERLGEDWVSFNTDALPGVRGCGEAIQEVIRRGRKKL